MLGNGTAFSAVAPWERPGLLPIDPKRVVYYCNNRPRDWFRPMPATRRYAQNQRAPFDK